MPDINIADLQRRIAELERDKRVLEAKLKEQQLLELREREKLKKRIEELEQEIENLKAEKVTYEGKFSKLESEMKDMKERMDRNIRPLEDQQTTEAYMLLAEMCHRLQNKMYKEVHPSNYIENFNFTVEMVEDHTSDIYDTEQEEEEAQGRWKRLKERIGWHERFKDTLAFLIFNRNKLVHEPRPKEEDLQRCVDLLHDEFTPRGPSSAERVHALIHMYQQF